MPNSIEMGLPFLRLGGCLLAWKGPRLAEEMAAAGKALETLGGAWGEMWEYELPDNPQTFTLLEVRKVGRTPDRYPRNPGQIRKRPL